MASETDSAATVHYPSFITEPGSPDVLFNLVVVLLLVAVFLIGAFYFRLHALPEQMAHSKSPAQYQFVAILALIGLLTHNALFWIAALLLAAVSIPDFLTPLRSIAKSLQMMSGSEDAEAPPSADVTRDTRAAAHDFVDRDEWEGKDA